SDSATLDPGTDNFTWSTYDVEGPWHWTVKATDDLGRPSTADQTFRYALTLSALKVPRSSRNGVKTTFTLSRPARIGLRVETTLGTLVAATAPVPLDAGAQSLSWDGKTSTGANAPAGSYVARVTADS